MLARIEASLLPAAPLLLLDPPSKNGWVGVGAPLPKITALLVMSPLFECVCCCCCCCAGTEPSLGVVVPATLFLAEEVEEEEDEAAILLSSYLALRLIASIRIVTGRWLL